MTGLIDNFKEALVYPTKDYKALLILGVIFIFTGLSSIAAAWQIELNATTLSIFGLISFIVSFIIQGYIISVMRESINLNDEIPALDIANNFVDGIKYLVVEIVYYIIPAILVLIVGWLSGTFSAVLNIVEYVGEDVANTTVNATALVNSIPEDYWAALFSGLVITAIFAMILFIIFGLLLQIAMCRLAKYDSIGEALNIKEVIGDIKEIGIGKYIAWYILILIIIMVLAIIMGIISAIPYIGVILGLLVFAPFIALFVSRSIATLYSEAQ